MLRGSVLVPYLLALFALCAGDQWLMQGDFVSPSEARQRELLLDTTNSTTSVSSSIRVTLATPPRHAINCVIAAALHMNGDVSLLEGGVGSSSVTLAYETVNGMQDLFFVLVQSQVERKMLEDGLEVRGNVGKTSRVTILYDGMREWQGMEEFGNGNGSLIDVESGEEVTFAEIKDRSVRCALWLKKQGVGPGDIVAVAVDNQVDDCVPMLATFYVGAIFNPWPRNWETVKVTRHYVQSIRPKIMFVDKDNAEAYMQAAKYENVETKFVVYGHHRKVESLQEIMSQQSLEEVENFRPIEIADPRKQPGGIFFSSGSTGMPKQVLLSYNFILELPRDVEKLQQGRSILWYSKLDWYSGSYFIIKSIVYPQTRIIHKEFDVEKTSQIIQKYKVGMMLFSRTLLMKMCESQVFARYDFSSLAVLMLSSAGVGQFILKNIESSLKNARVVNVYGMTEAAGTMCVTSLKCKNYESVGHVVAGVKLKVVDLVSRRTLGPNEKGEILIKSIKMMLGYNKEPEITKAVFDNEGWFVTGDFGYYDDNGEVIVIDRIRNAIRCRFGNVWPSSIEQILMNHKGVLTAAVVGVSCDKTDQAMTFVKTLPGVEVNDEELKEMIRCVYEGFEFCDGVKFVHDIPHRESGKLDRAALKELAMAYYVTKCQ